MHPVEILLNPLGRAVHNRRAHETASIAHAPELASENRIALSSPSFGDGEVIPARHCGWLIGQNISPGLSWDELPPATADLVLVMEDLDSPGVAPRIHLIAAFAPTAAGLPEGALTSEAASVRYRAGRRGPRTYAGPRPLPGHGTHRYRLHLYAIDNHLDLTVVAGAEDLPAALHGHVLASGTLTGTRTSGSAGAAG